MPCGDGGPFSFYGWADFSVSVPLALVDEPRPALRTGPHGPVRSLPWRRPTGSIRSRPREPVADPVRVEDVGRVGGDVHPLPERPLHSERPMGAESLRQARPH